MRTFRCWWANKRETMDLEWVMTLGLAVIVVAGAAVTGILILLR